MATQVIALNAPTALTTPTLRVFADGSDTQVSGSPFTLVEATNRKGYYEVSFTGTLSGLHQAVLYTGSSPISNGWVQLLNASATYTVMNDRGVNVGWIASTSQAVPGAAGGLVIAGSNAATTFAGLTTGALSCTTITASGAVAFQSTFAVTTSTALGAISGSTLTLSGAVAFQSTFAVTTSTALGAISGSTLTLSGAVAFQSTFATTGTTTFNAFTVTNAFTVSGATTLTGAITGTNVANDLRINGKAPGTSLGLLIAGSNTGTTTFDALTVTGATTLAAVSGTTLTLTGAVTATNVANNIVGVGAVASVTGAVGSVTGSVGSVVGSVGSVVGLTAANLDVAVSSRMATYTQPTGFLAATFPATVASTTNITGGTITTTTNLTNLPTIPANWITAAGIADNAIDTATFAAGATLPRVTLVDTITTYTGNTPQTGDSFARIGAPVGASISADVAGVQADTDNIQTRLPAALVSGRMDASVGAMAADTLTASALATDAVTEIQSGLATAANLATVAGYLDTEVAAVLAVTNKLDTALVLDGAVYQFTANALELAPTWGTAPTASQIADEVQTRTIAGVTLVATTTNLTNLPAITTNWLTAAGLASDAVSEIQSGLATASALATVQADTDDIQTRLPAALVSGRMDSSVGAYPGNTAQTGDVSTVIAKLPSGNIADQTTLTTVAGYLDTEVAAIKAKTDNLPASPAATGDAMTLTSGERDSIAAALLDLASGVETGVTVRQSLRAIAAALAGNVTGGGTATELFKALGNSGTTRLSNAGDASGNRTITATL